MVGRWDETISKVLISSCSGKPGNVGASSSFSSSVTASLGFLWSRGVKHLCRTLSHQALGASPFPGESCSLSQQCYFLLFTGFGGCWEQKMLVGNKKKEKRKNTFCCARIEKEEKQTKQME